MRRLYDVLTRLALPLALAVLLWRGIREPGYRRHLAERLGFGPALPRSGAIWLHAVSLGEMNAAAPLVRRLRSRHPGLPFAITTATVTGRARAQQLFGDGVDVRYLPFDTPGAMRRLLDRLAPRVALVLETELWPNLYRACGRRGVPVVLASARLSPASVGRYRRFAGWFRPALAAANAIAAQTDADAGRFVAAGADPSRVSVTGNLKFDVEPQTGNLLAGARLRAELWPGRPVWIAGSTHAGEEDAVLDAHAALRERQPDLLLLLVPRHPPRFPVVSDLLARRGMRYQRRSAGEPVSPDTAVLLVDTVGELASLYAAADVAFVGGTLVPIGGHNLLEPAALGVPVITGPFTANAAEVARRLLEVGGGVQVGDAAELASRVRAWFEDPALRLARGRAARDVIDANRGALERLLAIVEPLLADG